MNLSVGSGLKGLSEKLFGGGGNEEKRLHERFEGLLKDEEHFQAITEDFETRLEQAKNEGSREKVLTVLEEMTYSTDLGHIHAMTNTHKWLERLSKDDGQKIIDPQKLEAMINEKKNEILDRIDKTAELTKECLMHLDWYEKVVGEHEDINKSKEIQKQTLGFLEHRKQKLMGTDKAVEVAFEPEVK